MDGRKKERSMIVGKIIKKKGVSLRLRRRGET